MSKITILGIRLLVIHIKYLGKIVGKMKILLLACLRKNKSGNSYGGARSQL